MNLDGYEFLKDRLNSDKGETMLKITNELEEVANSIGMPLVNLALGWCLQNKNVSTVILGASNSDQLKQNLRTVDYLEQFDDALTKQINDIIS
jgi:aryl-alcohol dehydrogenase-like predicted oxidoreductase